MISNSSVLPYNISMKPLILFVGDSITHGTDWASKIDFAEVKKRIEASEIDYFDNPYRRFVGSKFEQETFFVEDPNGNVLEIKTMSNPEILFEVAS